MKNKLLLLVALVFTTSVLHAELGGMGADMVKDAATDAVKEKVTDSAKDMVTGSMKPKADTAKATDAAKTGDESPATTESPTDGIKGKVIKKLY